MEKRIELERRGKEPSQIKELNLDNARATQIEGLSDEYTNLESLSLINVGLTTLKGFPKLPAVKKLELSDNRISNGLTALQECPMLSHLNLSNNKIKDLEALEPLKTFENLTHLDLFNNEICNIEDYRKKVFKLLTSLKYLDDADENEQDVEDESDVEDGDLTNGALEEDDDDDDGEEEGEEESGDESGDDDGPGLAAIYNDTLDDDEDGDDFDEDGEEEEDDDDDFDDEDGDNDEPKGKKRKVAEGGGNDETA